MLRLSRYVLPEVRQGLYALEPQNMSVAPGRVAFATALVARAERLIHAGDVDGVQAMREYVPFAAELMKVTGMPAAPQLEVLPEFADAVSFDETRLGVLLRDGRVREPDDMVYLPTGEATASVLGLLRAAAGGIERAALLQHAGELDVGFDGDLLDGLIARGVIEEVAAPDPAAPPGQPNQPNQPDQPDDGMAWIGHAFVVARHGGTSVWFDPYPSPAFVWSPQEREEVFAAAVPDQVLLADYGPAAVHVERELALGALAGEGGVQRRLGEQA